MFLVERLVGVLTYVSVIVAVYWYISRTRSLSKRKIAMMLYLVSISIMAYFYVPYITADVYRLIEYMNTYAAMPVSEFISAISESGIPATLLYYRLIGSLDNPGLLSAITTFIVFSNIFYIIYNYSKNHKSNSKSVAVSLLTIMSTGIYMQTVGNIRTMLAFSIIARCFYDETVNEKKLYKNTIWYLIACLIHPVAIVAVMLRLGVYVWSNIYRRKTRAILLSVISLPIVAYFALRFGGERFLDTISEKAYDYINVVEYSYVWDTVITILTLGLIFISYRIYKHFSQNEKGLSFVIEFSWVLSITALVLFFEHASFVRFTQLNLIIMIPVIIFNISKITSSNPERITKILYRLYGFIVIAIFFISATRGALSSLKFFALA